jgi:Ser-tRNA(Ala) deacylase AlaX
VPVKKLFWEFPYLTKINAKVTSVNKDAITIDQTIAFAFSGGQESDSGTIGGYEIIEARKESKEIFYLIGQDHGLKPGDDVVVKIDWDKRYKIMKLHFAAELILELVYQNYDRPERTGAHISAEKARLDFYWEGNISGIFPLLTSKVQKIINSDLDIISDFTDEDNEGRFWQIEGFAKVPCVGTHLKKTGEIGAISLKRNNIGKGKERIEIYL